MIKLREDMCLKKMLFVLLFLPVTLFAGEVVDLSSNVWRFSKSIDSVHEITDELRTHENALLDVLLDDDRETTMLPDDNGTFVFYINMGKTRNLSSLKIFLSNKDAREMAYKVEASQRMDGGWNMLADFTADPQPCLLDKRGEISSVDTTVGYVEKLKDIYCRTELKGEYQYLRVSVLSIGTTDKLSKKNSITDIKVYVSDNMSSALADIVKLDYDDSQWEKVGIPHCYNDKDTYLNTYWMKLWRGDAWYRTKFFIPKKWEGKQIVLHFKSIAVAAGVYVNGIFMPGNTQVPQNGEVTHVGGFIPFAVNITECVKYGAENILSVRISNLPNSFFTWPGFGTLEIFGMGWGGIFSSVTLHIQENVHIPLDVYSALGDWGTYNAVKQADEQLGVIQAYTKIRNSGSNKQKVKLVSDLIDKDGTVVSTSQRMEELPAGGDYVFAQELNVVNPHLWYPNNSDYGIPYLYKLRRRVYLKNRLIDENESMVGIRVVTWDDDYCYVNGKKHIIRGFGHRNIYPALGAAMPEELIWKDMSYIAQCGGNALRVGHLPPFSETLDACDYYGIMVILNSGDDEWALKNEPAKTYKREYDRNAIIAFRNHPSVIIWEANNGIARDGDIHYPSETQKIVDKYDSINPRIVLSRDCYPKNWDPQRRIVVGYSNTYAKVEGSPSINTEVYGANWEGRASWNIARFDYENEKRFSMFYVNDYLSNIRDRACGWIDWMLAETQGEGYTIYLNGATKQKSIGSSAMDANRFPKLKYRIYQKALWIPFEKQPGVALQSDWNLGGIQNVDAWSNCPFVELFINGKSWGIRIPDEETKRCTWENLVWTPGEVKVVGMDENKQPCCNDIIYSSTAPHRIVLEVEKPLICIKDNKPFKRQANGSDVVIVTAKVLDKDGHLCTHDSSLVKFEILGNGQYCGSSNFYIENEAEKGWYYHTPGDYELRMEGGLMRIAVRSTFLPGKVQVKAHSNGLISGECEFVFENCD